MQKSFKKWVCTGFLFCIQGILVCYFWMSKLVRVYERDNYYLKEQLGFREFQLNRYMDKWNIMINWKHLEQKSISIGQWLYTEGYKKAAIYGLGEIGELLAKEFINSDLSLLYIIDKEKGDQMFEGVPVFGLESAMEPVDCMVVTTVRNFEEIQEQIERKGKIRLFAMEDLIKIVGGKKNDL